MKAIVFGDLDFGVRCFEVRRHEKIHQPRQSVVMPTIDAPPAPSWLLPAGMKCDMAARAARAAAAKGSDTEVLRR